MVLGGFEEQSSGQASYVSRRLDLVKTMRTAGIGLFMAVAVLPRVNTALAEAVGAQGDWAAWARVFLYFAVLLLIAAWIVSSYLEVNYLSAWATRIPYESVSPTFEAFMVVLVAVSLSVLLAFVENPALFGYAFALYALIDILIWTFALRATLTSIFATSIEGLTEELVEETAPLKRALKRNQIACLQQMQDYYGSRFQLLRRIGVLAVALALLPWCAGWVGWPDTMAGRDTFLYFAYGLLVLTGEGVLLHQRISLDRAVFECESRRQTILAEEAA